ncbi:MAG: methylenetetrahydrofolate--tRNA-(uracil(54)-C(5))-methyltransferase (FADH(2)-oxidizing) TrmFO [Chloroflexi bacterium]|nr:methylenetetrahydrofolate--tRNA-(uracil(54)-C(5))-methyltransferase (FADH(2)-oxidizing) TrmFO [Chloroflexota bacterium]MBI3732227.1 methylenetetrahydrofolate--tRNA-(uracil(54)-C(5))-methyltransferase (FADH(2)-oxidizing) TrmFO [Chloroflexota bacterium]
MANSDLIVVGGGLAGCEAAWQAAQRGLKVDLYEMRPANTTPAHVTDQLAEIVCSNSLGANSAGKASGLLKAELRRLGSLILACADAAAVPAGEALAVDRDRFSSLVTERIVSHPRIALIREEVCQIPLTPTIIASGPLTSAALTGAIITLCGEQYLYFYDAMCPIIARDSIDMSLAWRGSRYGREAQLVEGDSAPSGDYINCPLSQAEYEAFVQALIGAETIELKSFESEDPRFFEGCLPIEVMARRGRDTLAYGPMRPVGLRDPRVGRRPYAAVQLRQDNLADTLYNLVGFQTNLKWAEQKRVLRLIPGLQNAEIMRYGQMHRNTFINSPTLLNPTMQFRQRSDLFFAGQIVGVEGYVGNAGSGWLAGVNAARLVAGEPLLVLAPETMLGALCHYVCHAAPEEFQPMKANFGILPPLVDDIRSKRARHEAFVARALNSMELVMRSLVVV